MKGVVRSVAVAFAIANLYLLSLTGPLVSPEHQLVFHAPFPVTPLFLAAITDLVGVTAMITGLLVGAKRRPRLGLVLWAALLLPLPWVLVETVASFSGQPASVWLLSSMALGAVVVWAVVVARRRALLPMFRRLKPMLTTLLSFVALSGVLILGQLIWLGWKARGLNVVFVPRTAPIRNAAAGTAPRVVWIILDELSYRQVYGHRAAGLPLPNFDRLAAEATVFPHAEAAAQYTRIAVPSLLTGKPLSATNPTADGRNLLLHRRGQRGWQRMVPEDTVFGDAVADGLSTGVAGWYEPYCRVLPGVLDRCFWTYRDNLPGGLSAAASAGTDVLRPARNLAARLRSLAGLGPPPLSDGALDVLRHRADFEALATAGDHLLAEQRSGLILLHMPIPHPWGFYDRRGGSFPGHRTSYLDNLALADVYLGHVRALLESQGSWEGTDVIVMGDHGWRAENVWRRSGFWTAEDEAASRGAAAVDPPAMVVKLHGQSSPAVSAQRFDAVRTRALIGALLQGRIRSSEELERWVEQPTAKR